MFGINIIKRIINLVSTYHVLYPRLAGTRDTLYVGLNIVNRKIHNIYNRL